MRVISILLVMLMTTGCATARGRFLLGAGVGAVTIGGGATLLSPNVESRGLNALVFGLVGALVGGGLGLLLGSDDQVPKSKNSLQEKQQGTASSATAYAIPTDSKLPKFVRERLQPVVVEEMFEPDSVSDDGTLHEPHKIYRIQKPAELYANPGAASKQVGGAQ